jgi:hypothetical protein
MATDPDRNEWYFEECPPDEIDYCWTYEYARESEPIRKVITKWRQGAKGSKVEDYIALADEINAEPVSLSVYQFLPSWPDKPYLSIEPKIRKAWLDRIGMPWDFGEEPYEIQARHWSRESTLDILERFARGSSLSFRNGYMQFVIFNLDWHHHDKELEALFRRWLKQNRPKDAKAVEMRGRGNPASKGRTNLKYLSAYRLDKKMSKDDAMELLAAECGKTKSYRKYQDWNLAVKRAKAIIRSLEAGTFIVPPWEDGSLGEPINEKFLRAMKQSPLF